MLRAQSLSLGYGSQAILEDISLEIQPGDFWCLLGPNGTGKTTFLRGVLGEIKPLSGTLEFNTKIARQEHVGFVPQRCEVNPTLPTTVQEFVTLGLVGLRATRSDRTQKLGWALERVGLGGHERTSYWDLSGGQRQRALVARALIRRPSFLILDEPTVGLDLPTRETLLADIKRLNRDESLTTLFVTHDLTSAVHHASHLAFFVNGTILAGRGETILTAENLERTFGVPFGVQRDDTGAVSVHFRSSITHD